jgi:HEAT repeat protein
VAGDSFGSSAILEEEVIPSILDARLDKSVEVRGNVYECFYQLTRTTAGVIACVNAGVSKPLAKLLFSEDESLQPVLLRYIYNMSSLEAGLNDALDSNAVKLCIEFLASNSAPIRIEAARTLGYLCFSDRGKDLAVANGAVQQLLSTMVAFKDDVAILSSGSSALMAITSTDEGKRQMNTANSVTDMVVQLLLSPNKVVALNALKIISNIAVHPMLRSQLKKDADCVPALKKLVDEGDAFTRKHAKLALDAVMWKP